MYGNVPHKPGWSHLYIKKEEAESEESAEIKALIERWCREKQRTCNIVLIGKNRELPGVVQSLPCLRSGDGYQHGSMAIKRYILHDLRPSKVGRLASIPNTAA